MKARNYKYLVGDFETTVYEGQTYTEVWASACVELFTEDVKIFQSIDEQYEYFLSLDCDLCVYYHNLKFDGSFWLSYLTTVLNYSQAYTQHDTNNVNTIEWLPVGKMRNKTFSYSITEMGQWYRITIKDHGHIIELRDSLKLLPFSVRRIGDSFKTKHKKLDMDYTGFRYAGCNITDEEKHYIANDVLVVKEALEFMFQQGHYRLTIGSCCMAEYKKTLSGPAFDRLFPPIYDMPIDPIHGQPTAGDWIHKAYRGGWCYVVKDRSRQLLGSGFTADVNSLYPSMMHSESGNRYPVGQPHFWHGDHIPDEALKDSNYYFIRIRTRFYLKKNKLPFIQIKDNLLYKGTESLATSDIFNHKDGKYYPEYIDFDGNLQPARVTLTLTMTDFELIKEHYDLKDCEIIDGCWFRSAVGIFDTYIEKYKTIKLSSKGAMRELAKLFLNNLYGKMAANKNSSFRVAYEKEDRSIGFMTVRADDKKPGYIPVGAAITSYARNFTIRAAQQNYYGPDKPGFVYADTDSIHCDIPEDQVKGITIHDKNFCCWKIEGHWDKAVFVRQKTYIEHTEEEGYVVKCAGMPKRCKELFLYSMGEPIPEEEKLSDDEKDFLKTPRKLTDFDLGLVVPGKLLPRRIPGGTVLKECCYEMR